MTIYVYKRIDQLSVGTKKLTTKLNIKVMGTEHMGCPTGAVF